jgi:RNase P/RNase MRP subunit p29
MSEAVTSTTKERLFLRQWIGKKVSVVTGEHGNYGGHLTNIVFDGNRLMYIMLDDRQCLNFDHIIEITLSK